MDKKFSSFLKNKWSKYIFISIILSILVIVGSIIFINKNFSTSKNNFKNYSIVKFVGIDYPFELTFDKNNTIKEALISIGYIDIKRIYELKGKDKIIRSINDKLTQDCTLEIQLN